MIKFIKKIIFFIVLIFAIVISYFLYNGYQLYEKVTSTVSIEDKIKQIQNNKNYTTLNNVSRHL